MDRRKNNGKSRRSRDNQKARKKLQTLSRDDVVILYNEHGWTLKEIGKKYDTTAATMLRFFRENNIKTKTKTEIQTKRMSCIETREKLRQSSIRAYLNRRKFDTKPETHFALWLDENHIKYEKQWRHVGNGHPYDFFLIEFNLIVEIDGYYWHSKPEQQIKDKKHVQDAIFAGFDIIRINTIDVKSSSYDVLLGEYIVIKRNDDIGITEIARRNREAS